MRVTQSMLTNNNLKYISNSYSDLQRLSDQITTGKKITKPSDDPVVAMKGMRYRTQVAEIKQYQRNLNEGYNWMENADTALDSANQILQKIRELTVQASNDTYDETARKNIVNEITTLQEQLVTLAETKVGDKYIFNGTDTASSPMNLNQINMDFGGFQAGLADGSINPSEYVINYQGNNYTYDSTDNMYKDKNGSSIKIDESTGEITYTYQEELAYKDGETVAVEKNLDSESIVISKDTAVSTNSNRVLLEVSKGVSIPVNVVSNEAFSLDMFGGIEAIKKMISDPDATGKEITKSLDAIDGYINNVVSTQSQLGAQLNRAEMVESRLKQQEVVANKTLSENEDMDFEEAVMGYLTQQMVHNAALQVGAQIIQRSLVDFLR
ncbi:flagellar hook-associated protein FlgL [Niallia sp. FSL M8-0099]|uniref:flagellar hook-associated protein FlgL n=1 Tax=Niallia sp. FSL M8-0099 TaxID=2954519 RepID=UPI0030FCD6C0